MLLLFMILANDLDETTHFALETADFSVFPETSHVRIGPKGRVYVADPDQSKIRVFDPSGKHLFSFGNKGAGPGEFKRWFGTFTLGRDGTVYQLDHWGGNRWVNLFGADGTFKRIFSLRAIEDVFGGRDIFALNGGGFVIGYEQEWRTGKLGSLFTGGSDVRFTIVNQDESLGKRLIDTHLLMEISENEDSEGRPFPHAPDILSAHSPERGVLAWQISNADTVSLIDLTTGNTIQVPNGFQKRPMAKESIQAFVEKRMATEIPAKYRAYETRLYGKMLDLSSKLEMSLPIVHKLFFNEKGALFLVSGPEGSDTFTVHVLDINNQMIRKFQTTAIPVGFHGGRAYYLKRNEEEGTAAIFIKSQPKGF